MRFGGYYTVRERRATDTWIEAWLVAMADGTAIPRSFRSLLASVYRMRDESTQAATERLRLKCWSLAVGDDDRSDHGIVAYVPLGERPPAGARPTAGGA